MQGPPQEIKMEWTQFLSIAVIFYSLAIDIVGSEMIIVELQKRHPSLLNCLRLYLDE